MQASQEPATGSLFAARRAPTVSSFTAILLLLAGLAVVVAGAELFFEAVLAAAGRLRVSPVLLTVVLSGFELENLAAGIAANAKGLPGAAAGTFLGGTIFLALGVTGISGLVAPMRARLPRTTLMWTAASPLPLLLLSLDGRLSRVDGAVLLVWFVAALAGIAHGSRLAPAAEARPKRLIGIRLLAGMGLLAAGGELLSEGIRQTVTRLGVSQTLLGNTVIAASVEAEEVVRVVIPAKRKRSDIALANIMGTIVHFAAFNAGVIALVKPLELDDASRYLHLPMTAAAVLILVAVLGVRVGVRRPEAAVLLALYGGYLAAAIIVAI